MAWRSQEQGYQMRQRMNKPSTGNTVAKRAVDPDAEERIAALEKYTEQLKKPVVDEKGNFSVKAQDGETARNLFSMMGLHFSSMG